MAHVSSTPQLFHNVSFTRTSFIHVSLYTKNHPYCLPYSLTTFLRSPLQPHISPIATPPLMFPHLICLPIQTHNPPSCLPITHNPPLCIPYSPTSLLQGSPTHPHTSIRSSLNSHNPLSCLPYSHTSYLSHTYSYLCGWCKKSIVNVQCVLTSCKLTFPRSCFN